MKPFPCNIFNEKPLIQPERTMNPCIDAQFLPDLPKNRSLHCFVQLNTTARQIVIGRVLTANNQKLSFMQKYRTYTAVEDSLFCFECKIHPLPLKEGRDKALPTVVFYFLALSAAMMRFMASMPTLMAPEVSSVIGISRPAFSRS